jgi:intracellular sulfur oxidation DsrE/DsrF family protein
MGYKAVFHIDLEDDQLFNLCLNNITNTLDALKDTDTDFVLLANGPGVAMLAGETVYLYFERIKQLLDAGVRFQVCNRALEKFEIEPKDLADGVEIISAGIVGLIDLQNDGFAYIKP